LKENCGTKTHLRAEIDSLLLAYSDEKGLLKAPPDLLEEPNTTLIEAPGTVIGCYKLLEKIGEGGMAMVYMAEQERPIRRKAALKIIKLGMDTKSVIARFEAERQALAMIWIIPISPKSSMPVRQKWAGLIS
jgi:serine/threonine protein kinase